jgi:hypothetical protein
LLAALFALAHCAGASAIVAHVPGGKAVSYQPLRGPGGFGGAQPLDEYFSNLDYNGGPVMPANANYAVYWQPAGAPAYPSEYEPGIDRYLEDLAHDSGGHENVDSVAAQYNDTAGELSLYSSSFAGAIVDTDPYPASGCTAATICLTDKQIRTELTNYVRSHGLPHDLSHEYFLLTPPGVESCFEAASRVCSAGSASPYYCAYHGNIPVGEGEIVYADDPYVTGNAGCDDGNHPNGPSDGALEGGLSHEHDESLTDPEPNNAWTDIGGVGGEIGDKCSESMGAALGKAPNGASYNQVVNGHYYWYQEEWSNQGARCLQRLTFSGSEPTAAFTATPHAGEEVSFDASGSTAPGGVYRYNWQFNEGAGPSGPVETTGPTVAHTFAAAGVYIVALTVFAADGTSIGTSREVLVGSVPAPTVTKVTPAKGPPAGGTIVTISGTSFTGATSVLFGSTPAAGFDVNSPKSITALSPAATAGLVDIRVTAPGGTSAITTYDHFKFAPPTVTGVAPSSGPAAGGTSVTIAGTGFAPGTGGTVLKFGGVLATNVSCSSPTACTATSPAHKAGTVDVKATVNGLASPKVAADRFTYF